MGFGDASADLLFHILAASSQAQKEFKTFRSFIGTEVNQIVRAIPGGGFLNSFSDEIRRASKLASTDFGSITGAAGFARKVRWANNMLSLVTQHIATYGLDFDFSGKAGAAGGAGGALAGIAGPSAAAAAGVVAVAGVAVAAGTAIFELTKKTAEYGAAIWDAHLKTGVSVETLSAFKYALDTNNSSLGQFSNGLVRFTTNLGQAQAGNKKLSAELRSLGVTAFNDSEKALRQFATGLANLRTDQERTLALSQVFGARLGANLSGAFKSIGGDLDAYIEKLREAGRVMSNDTARQAYEFRTALIDTNKEIQAIEREVGNAFLPLVLDALKDIDRYLKQNRTNVKTWAKEWVDDLREAEYKARAFNSFMESVYGKSQARQDAEEKERVGMPTMDNPYGNRPELDDAVDEWQTKHDGAGEKERANP
jgi:hypothetical protein